MFGGQIQGFILRIREETNQFLKFDERIHCSTF
jgi:hypothetical protein